MNTTYLIRQIGPAGLDRFVWTRDGPLSFPARDAALRYIRDLNCAERRNGQRERYYIHKQSA